MRTSPDRQYQLHDRLARLKAAFRTMYRGGGVLTPRDAERIDAELAAAIDEACLLYAELSAKRWNERATADPLAEVVLAEAAKPGSSVLLFTKRARPLPAGAVQLGSPFDQGSGDLPADSPPQWNTHDEGDDCA